MNDLHKAHFAQPPLNHLFNIPSHVTSKMKILAWMFETIMRSHWLKCQGCSKIVASTSSHLLTLTPKRPSFDHNNALCDDHIPIVARW